MRRYFEINESGCNIRCKLYCEDPRSIRRAILMPTGFGGHKDNRAAERFAERVLSKYHGMGIIVFNWPCHGDDVRKKLTLPDCLTYLRLTEDYIRRTWTEELYAYGTSFGGFMLLYALTQGLTPCTRTVLRCPAVKMYDTLTKAVMTPENEAALARGRDAAVGFDRKVSVGRSFLEELRAADLTGFDFLDFAEDLLILHGTKDEIVPIADSEAFCDSNLIELVPIEGADHRFQNPDHMEQATKAALQFFAF